MAKHLGQQPPREAGPRNKSPSPSSLLHVALRIDLLSRASSGQDLLFARDEPLPLLQDPEAPVGAVVGHDRPSVPACAVVVLHRAAFPLQRRLAGNGRRRAAAAREDAGEQEQEQEQEVPPPRGASCAFGHRLLQVRGAFASQQAARRAEGMAGGASGFLLSQARLGPAANRWP